MGCQLGGGHVPVTHRAMLSEVLCSIRIGLSLVEQVCNKDEGKAWHKHLLAGVPVSHEPKAFTSSMLGYGVHVIIAAGLFGT